MFELINYKEVLDELIELMMDHDIEMYRYQRDVYLYVEHGYGYLEIFDNVGGCNWIDDDHTTVCCMRECTESWSDTWQDEQQIADVLGCTEEHLIESVCEWMAAEYGGYYEHDDIGYNDVYVYINHHQPLLDKMMAARAELIRDLRDEYADRAEYELDEALREFAS